MNTTSTTWNEPAQDAAAPAPPSLQWHTEDPEQRLGFRGGRWTRVNGWLTCLLGSGLAIVFYVALLPLQGTWFHAMFTQRGPTQYATVWLTGWSCAILLVKWRKLKYQRRAFAQPLVPDHPGFVLSTSTVEQVLQQIDAAADDPKQFLLFNRIVIALANLRNLGRVADVDEILRSQAEQEEAALETSYSLLQGFVWAIPVLGFIGTVLGLSESIGAFSSVLSSAQEVSQITSSLQGVTAGLATAFETTLVALVAALAIQLVLTALRKSEDEFLDEAMEYCTRSIVGKLRLLPLERESA